jgi:hypothetical protein
MTLVCNETLRWAHEANIQRYRKILRTPLTEMERQFVKRRLAEEQQAVEQIGQPTAISRSLVGGTGNH